MNRYKDFAVELYSFLDKQNIYIDEPMRKHTSFKVGGPVDILVLPEDKLQVLETIKLCKKNNIPFYIIGNGSNLLVKDGGIRGVVIKLTKLNNIEVNGEYIVADGGASLIRASRIALTSSLAGFEFACGIPGSVGGALNMNAGAYNGEMSQIVESAEIIDSQGNIKSISFQELELDYRTSAIMKYGYIVLSVKFKLKKGNYEEIKCRMDELTVRRVEKQPLDYPSAGSTFRRPEGSFAPKLIEETGLKGLCVRDAQVSPKHSGFIINKGSAKAQDILELIDIVQNKVKEKFDIELHTEVIIIGDEELN